MKYIFSVIVAVLLVQTSLFAQQEPLFAQYSNNAFLINPAVAGSRGNHSLNLFHRWQWVAFPGAPQTFGFGYQGLIKNMHGLGGLIFSDITGPSSRFGMKASYAFHIPLNENKMRLSIGVAGRLTRNLIRTTTITFYDSNDAAVVNAGDGVTGGDAEFGLYLYAPKFYVGFSAPNLIQTKLNFGANTTGRNPIGHGYRHYFLQAGYRFALKDQKTVIEPSVMVKYVQGPYPQIDGGVMARLLNNQLAFGVFYRTPGFISFQSRFVFDNQIPLLLSFDVAVTRFQNFSVGATEIMLGYDFMGKDVFAPSQPKGPEGEL